MSIMMDAAIFSAFLRHVNYGGYYYFLSIFTQCQLCWVELISQGFYLMSIMADDIFLSICMLCQLWRMRLYFSICTSCQSWWMLHVKHFYVMWIMAHAIIFSVFFISCQLCRIFLNMFTSYELWCMLLFSQHFISCQLWHMLLFSQHFYVRSIMADSTLFQHFT